MRCVLVTALVASGGTIYAGGSFTSIGGAARGHLAALDATTGIAAAWDPSVTGDFDVPFTLAVGRGTVYVGGNFGGIANLPQSYLAAIEAVNEVPDCSHAEAVPSLIIARNRRFVPVNIAGVTDADGDPIKITVTRVTQDEPLGGRGDDDDEAVLVSGNSGLEGDGQGTGNDGDRGGHHGIGGREHDGDECADAIIDGKGAVEVRAERSGKGNGRVYTIWFSASDGRGGTCDGSVKVCVPHDRHHLACIDDGQNFNSLAPCPGRRRPDRAATAEVTLTLRSPHIVNISTFEYSLPAASDVLIAVYDIAGR